MTATGHAIIGTIIAAKIGNPALAVPIALASHVAADLFPHWDVATNRRSKSLRRMWLDAALDAALGLIIMTLLVHYVFPQTKFSYALLIVFAAEFFDIITAPYLFLNWKFPPFSWAYKFQKLFDNKLDKPWGIIGQAAILFTLVIFFKLN